jgi:hypothetical protein
VLVILELQEFREIERVCVCGRCDECVDCGTKEQTGRRTGDKKGAGRQKVATDRQRQSRRRVTDRVNSPLPLSVFTTSTQSLFLVSPGLAPNSGRGEMHNRLL